MSSEPTLGEILARALAEISEVPPLIRAAGGDAEAMRQLANAAYQAACAKGSISGLTYLAEALTFARLAAGASQLPTDLHPVVFLYGEIAAACRNLGEMDEGDTREAQGFLLAELAAESGDEALAQLVLGASDKVTPEAHKLAHQLREGC